MTSIDPATIDIDDASQPATVRVLEFIRRTLDASPLVIDELDDRKVTITVHVAGDDKPATLVLPAQDLCDSINDGEWFEGELDDEDEDDDYEAVTAETDVSAVTHSFAETMLKRNEALAMHVGELTTRVAMLLAANEGRKGS